MRLHFFARIASFSSIQPHRKIFNLLLCETYNHAINCLFLLISHSFLVWCLSSKSIDAVFTIQKVDIAIDKKYSKKKSSPKLRFYTTPDQQ